MRYVLQFLSVLLIPQVLEATATASTSPLHKVQYLEAMSQFDQEFDKLDTVKALSVVPSQLQHTQQVIWAPWSGSPTSVCALSGCLMSVCFGSGCGGSGCFASTCGGSLCAASGCSASACGASLCLGSGCAGSGCGGSLCVASGCLGSACGASACLGSVCGGSGCLGSACGVSGCGVSVCVGTGCVLSGCGLSGCGLSGCVWTSCHIPGSGCSCGPLPHELIEDWLDGVSEEDMIEEPPFSRNIPLKKLPFAVITDDAIQIGVPVDGVYVFRFKLESGDETKLSAALSKGRVNTITLPDVNAKLVTLVLSHS